ncbi:hypothetical protein TcasGA2_TC003679 [Tribolium castaneum]|uniref:Uncharacterized protein n=1 Tax=Tribolium castaneum TaxID=7070 RepID=D6WDK8_TRICA|nr:hypothetical protein TcasGA2_TC003679 [Tribolium castaneum]
MKGLNRRRVEVSCQRHFNGTDCFAYQTEPFTTDGRTVGNAAPAPPHPFCAMDENTSKLLKPDAICIRTDKN